jgi:hypothetical protein
MAIEHGQQGQADAGAPGRNDDAMRELRRIGIARTVRRVVQIMELGDRRVAVQQAFNVELCRDRCHIVGCQDRDEAVHHLAPAPEIVACRAAVFRQARHGALEGVAVEVRHARHDEAGHGFGAFRRSRRDRDDGAIGCDVDQHIRFDAEAAGRGDQCCLGKMLHVRACRRIVPGISEARASLTVIALLRSQ